MPKHNAENERIKRDYFEFLKDSKGRNSATIDAVAAALDRFERHSRHRNFKSFNAKLAINFKKHLTDTLAIRTGERLSKATLHSTMRHLRSFFEWLSFQPGFRSTVAFTDASYFSIPEKDQRIATAERPTRFPLLGDVLKVIESMPHETELERRDRALIAFALLTGARDRAMASLKLGHIDLQSRCVFQDARQVKTKFSKSITTYFFPVGDVPVQIVVEWVNHLWSRPGSSKEFPLFPATAVGLNEALQFSPVGLGTEHWQSTGPIREIFRRAFEAAGLPYYNPHSIRKTLVAFGSERCKTPEEFKAWSQNLGHEQVLTTFTSYGMVQTQRQAELMQALGRKRDSSQADLKRALEDALSRI